MRFKFALLIGIFSLSAHAANVPRNIAYPVFCEALLWAGASGETAGPQASLEELRGFLAAQTKNPDDLPGDSPYHPIYFLDDLLEGLPQPMRQMQLRYVLGRLTALSEDSRKLSFDKSLIEFEFRGREKVEFAVEQALQEIHRRNPMVLEALRRRYPSYRLNELLRHLATGYILISPLLLRQYPEYARLANFMIPLGIAYAWVFEYLMPRLKMNNNSVTAFARQIAAMEQAFTSGFVTTPVAIVSEAFEIQTELHNSFMRVNDQALSPHDFEMMVNASEGMRRGYWDNNWEAREFERITRGMSTRQALDVLVDSAANGVKYYPDGQKRFIQFDSIFYVDPQTREPVWLVYYRAFKERPAAPGKTTPMEEPAAVLSGVRPAM